MKNNYPLCSVIILNYFGEKVLDDTLNSLFNLNYPKDKLEIIVVDNASKDESVNLIKDYAKKGKITPVFLDKNYGFSKGNNFGIKIAKGKYVALLNNDCLVDKNWLTELVTAAIKNPGVFAFGSKILLYTKFLNINFKVNSDCVPVYAWLSDSALMKFSERKDDIYLPLIHNRSENSQALDCNIELFFDPINDKTCEFTLILNRRATNSKVPSPKELLEIDTGFAKITSISLKGDDIECKIRVSVSDKRVTRLAYNKIQNAGIMPFQDGYCRDIGAIVRDSQQFYEKDNGQYEHQKEIYAACGAAVLYNKEILDDVGFLDEDFFMYYEDVEICERARFKGHPTIYVPKAIASHYHALSSKEGSPFFVYHVEKGRLMHLFLNFPLIIFLKEYLYMCLMNFGVIFRLVFSYRKSLHMYKTRKKSENSSKLARRMQTIRALAYYIYNAPTLIEKRMLLKRSKKNVEENYEKILKGDWYFK